MAGVTVSGVLWAVFQNNAGGAWDNAKKSFEAGVEINGEMLADISGEEVEKWMLAQGLVTDNEVAPDAPIDSACTDEQHAAMAAGKLPVSGKIRFFE